MTSTRITGLAIVFILMAATVLDPYGWHWWVSYHVGVRAWWKVAINALDVLLLALVGYTVSAGRWRDALRLGVLELGFAATLGLFVARGDLIRNAVLVDWLPAIRVLLGLYMGTLALRLVLVLLLRRVSSRVTGSATAAAS